MTTTNMTATDRAPAEMTATEMTATSVTATSVAANINMSLTYMTATSMTFTSMTHLSCPLVAVLASATAAYASTENGIRMMDVSVASTVWDFHHTTWLQPCWWVMLK